jgi:hypothetical protein
MGTGVPSYTHWKSIISCDEVVLPNEGIHQVKVELEESSPNTRKHMNQSNRLQKCAKCLGKDNGDGCALVYIFEYPLWWYQMRPYKRPK